MISGGRNEVDDNGRGDESVKKIEPHGIVVFCNTCFSVVCRQRIPLDLRKVTSDNSIEFYRKFDVDSHIKMLTVLNH